MLHVTPWLTTEQHRRLIGNDICLILYYDTEENTEVQFDPQVLDTLGIVPQVFTVVQPVKHEYLLGFFHRANLKAYRPTPPPRGYTFNAETIRDYLFTKLYNGYVMSTKCPPVNRLFSTPRRAAIETLGDYFLKKNKKHFKNRSSTKKKNLKKQEESVEVLPKNSPVQASPSHASALSLHSRIRSQTDLTVNKEHSGFAVIMGTDKSSFFTKEGQTLRELLESYCGKRGLELEHFEAKEIASGNIIPLETLLSNIPGFSVDLCKKNQS